MATLLCLSPQTRSIIGSIIPAGQGPACPQTGCWDAQAVVSLPCWHCQLSRLSSQAGVPQERTPLAAASLSQPPPASCSPQPFPQCRGTPGTAMAQRWGSSGAESGWSWDHWWPVPTPDAWKFMAKPPAPRSPPPVAELGALGSRRAAPVERRGRGSSDPELPVKDSAPPRHREASADRGDTARPCSKSHQGPALASHPAHPCLSFSPSKPRCDGSSRAGGAGVARGHPWGWGWRQDPASPRAV